MTWSNAHGHVGHVRLGQEAEQRPHEAARRAPTSRPAGLLARGRAEMRPEQLVGAVDEVDASRAGRQSLHKAVEELAPIV